MVFLLTREIYLFAAAALCLVASAVFVERGLPSTAKGHTFGRTLASLAAVLLLVGWGLALRARDAQPLGTLPELMMVSAIAAICCYVQDPAARHSRWAHITFSVMTVGLIMWATLIWHIRRGAPTLSLPTVSLAAIHVLLGVSCGTIVEAGSQTLAQLIASPRGELQPPAGVGACALLIGLPSLTASLATHLAAGLYSTGLIWGWSAVETSRLLLWLWYTIIWCSVVLLNWQGRRIWVLLSLGTLLCALVWIVGV